MDEQVKVAFASGTPELNQKLVEKMASLFPDLPLFVVSEFPPGSGAWIRYQPLQSWRENMARCRHALRGRSIRLAGTLLVPNLPYRRLRLMALVLSPRNFLAFNEHMDSFMLRPRNLPTIAKHAAWRTRNLIRSQCRPGGEVYTFFWRAIRPKEWRIPLLALSARAAGKLASWRKQGAQQAVQLRYSARPHGISLVIPSRDGRHLLEEMLPHVCREFSGMAGEILVVDNGSADETAQFLEQRYSEVRVILSTEPLSFARAVNRGIEKARYSHVCLLNNDMIVRAGFLSSLMKAFEEVPGLFCATAQIFFPEGKRREETGKAVWARTDFCDFPVRCDLPVDGENSSYVLYGSGGCSLYDAHKLNALGNVGEIYEPAYVEDLDLGYRGWQQGWPTVFVREAEVEHRHRATTSRFFTQNQLEVVLEVNHLRFLCRATSDPEWFQVQWNDAVERLRRLAYRGYAASEPALRFALTAPRIAGRPRSPVSEVLFTALVSGDVAVFPGDRKQRPRVIIASLFQPFPLAHGGAVRIYNLMRRCSTEYDLVLLYFASEVAEPPAELRAICAEIVVVRLRGSHLRRSTERPDQAEEYNSNAFRAAMRFSIRKWQPSAVQLELTPMAVFLDDAAPVPVVLVEHDITFDLYEQLARSGDWDHQQQLEKWRRFEMDAWRRSDVVITMSDQDACRVKAARVVTVPNGVDLERFQASRDEPERGRLLFIGSFAHLPNLMALEYFLHDVWPRLSHIKPLLHVIAGRDPERYLNHFRDHAQMDLTQPGIELEAFVADVRPAYRRACIVIAPLVASAGTNIKILEAMAMGKAIVSTPAGINGLDVASAVRITGSADEMAHAIEELVNDRNARVALERDARVLAEREYGWDTIAQRQLEIYRAMEHSRASVREPGSTRD